MRDRHFDGLLSTREAARILGLKARTLENWRRVGTGPTYSRIGVRSIRYSRKALQRYIEEHEQMSPSDMAALLNGFKAR